MKLVLFEQRLEASEEVKSYIYVCVCVYIYVCIYMCIYMSIYVYIYGESFKAKGNMVSTKALKQHFQGAARKRVWLGQMA